MCAVEKGELCVLGRGRVLSPFGLIFSAAGNIWGILGPVLEHRYFLVFGRMEFPFLVLPTFVAPSYNQREGAESQPVAPASWRSQVTLAQRKQSVFPL